MTDNTDLKKIYHDLIRINSITGNEKEIADYIAGVIEKMGLEVRWSHFEGGGENSPSIYTVLDSGRPGPALMLIGHIDTVKAAGGWLTDPFEPVEDGDRTYGLGAMDMKGGLSAILEALAYFKNNPESFNGKIIAAFVSDEENLSGGTFSLADGGLTADMAIMAECRDSIAVGFRGRYSIDVEVSGKAAHASHYPHAGENALLNASRLLIEIERLDTLTHPKLGGGTWCVRHIEGGVTNALIVPETCKMFVDRYFVVGETYETIKSQILEAAAKLGLEDKVKVNLRPRKKPYMMPFTVAEDHILVTSAQEAHQEVLGRKAKIEYDPSVCDSNILANEMNIPTITFGPSGANMHGANEYGHFDQVKSCAEIYIKTFSKISRQ